MTFAPALLLQDDAVGILGALLGGGIFLVMLAIGLICVAGIWKVFAKAGQPGWACIIPIYNVYVMTQIAGKPAWWILLMFIPLVSIVVGVLLCIEIAKAFGQGAGFGILMLFGIGWLMLGFGSYQYQGSRAAAAIA